MSLYSLPLQASIRPSSRAHLYPRTSQKRKRSSSPDIDTDDGDTVASGSGRKQSSLPADSINPLSLTPEEILQYKVAGLDLDQELPSESVPGFPHRPLPSSFNARGGVPIASHGASESETEGAKRGTGRERREPYLRIQHLSVLTTFLHRCLLQGDIPRASRAWSLLLRAQVYGKGVDIRESGYWGIGAELLMRSGEKPPESSNCREGVHSDASMSGSEDVDISDETTTNRKHDTEEVLKRWGTEGGLEKAKDYYERLILQYPYNRQYPNSINSLDFYPAMLSCEIYGIQFTQKEHLMNLEREERSASPAISEMEVSDEDKESAHQDDDSDVYYDMQRLKEARQKERRREHSWKKREGIRQVTLTAAEKVAARMDDLMILPPYSDNPALLRLRGMLALYIGDLNVPDLCDEDDGESHDGDAQHGYEGEISGADEQRAEIRLAQRRRRAEYERGLVRRDEEQERAIVFIRKG